MMTQLSPLAGGSEGQACHLLAAPTSHSLAYFGRCALCQPAAHPSCAALRALRTQSPVSDPRCSVGAAWRAGDGGSSASWLTDEPHGLQSQGFLQALQVEQAVAQVVLRCTLSPPLGQLKREECEVSAGWSRPCPGVWEWAYCCAYTPCSR